MLRKIPRDLNRLRKMNYFVLPTSVVSPYEYYGVNNQIIVVSDLELYRDYKTQYTSLRRIWKSNWDADDGVQTEQQRIIYNVR